MPRVERVAGDAFVIAIPTRIPLLMHVRLRFHGAHAVVGKVMHVEIAVLGFQNRLVGKDLGERPAKVRKNSVPGLSKGFRNDFVFVQFLL